MAISAYDSAGRLKKNPLLGTSLAVDPSRSTQRQAFEGLHKEAIPFAGQGRAPMESLLTQRFQTLGKPQTARLEELAQQKAGFEEEYRTLRDPEKEAGFQADIDKYSGFLTPFEGFEEYVESVRAAVPDPQDQERVISAMQRSGHMGGRTFDRLPDDAKLELEQTWKQLSEGERKAYKTAFKNSGSSLTNIQQFADVELKRRLTTAETGLSAYNKQINSEVDRINEQYIPLQAEATKRETKLADRVELYNMFLGN